MTLFINAANLRFGGGKTVGFNIINYYINNPHIKRIIITAPATCGYERFQENERVKIIFFPVIFNVSVLKIVSNYFVLPLLLLLNKTDFVLSLGNVAIPTDKPQFLLIHQPFLAYPESVVWKRMKESDKKFHFYISNMVRFIKSNLKYANEVGVQTEAMRSRLHRLYNIPLKKLHVSPNAISFTSSNNHYEVATDNTSENIKLLFLSKYYPHKNFEILYEVGEIIKARNLPLKIFVTIDAQENTGSRKFLENIISMKLDQYIVNLGNVLLEDVPKVYSQHDGLFLPTFLESFSGTYIEAMHFGKPVFTSDMDFAHEVCQDAAFYFNQVDKYDIIETIMSAYNDRETMQFKVQRGRELIAQSKSWDEIGQFIDKQILNLN